MKANSFQKSMKNFELKVNIKLKKKRKKKKKRKVDLYDAAEHVKV